MLNVYCLFSTTVCDYHCSYNFINYNLQIVAAFEFVVLLLVLLDLALTLMWLKPQRFFTDIMKVVEVRQLVVCHVVCHVERCSFSIDTILLNVLELLHFMVNT